MFSSAPMKILVPVKRVPDPDGPLYVLPDGTGIDASGAQFIVNPFDAIAIEEALRMREAGGPGDEVLAVSIGDEGVIDQLRTALAMGADRALIVECAPPLDPWNTARLLAVVVKREEPQLVLMGKQAVDDDANQTGQFLAALLGWPQATFASRIERVQGGQGTSARVARETDLGLETIEVRLPAVVTTDLRLNEPRYASLPSLMRARKRPIERITAGELAVAIEPRVRLARLETVSSRRNCVRVEDAAELVARLRSEAKVL
jgi:electron transfer flavoprotein beta subunit